MKRREGTIQKALERPVQDVSGVEEKDDIFEEAQSGFEETLPQIIIEKQQTQTTEEEKVILPFFDE